MSDAPSEDRSLRADRDLRADRVLRADGVLGDAQVAVNDEVLDLATYTKPDADPPLTQILRDDLGLYGVRAGCAVGECGACTVLADGEPIRSCRTPWSTVAGKRITTPEGLGTPDHPHPVQCAFLDEQAAQCGYCVNGMIMSVAGMLDQQPRPDETEIQASLAGHICRCGAQHRMLRAVRRLAGHEQPACASVRQLPAAPAESADSADPVDPPGALRAAPLIEDWLRPLDDGRVEVRSGRVELGQGVRTAFAQVVAAELDVPVEQVVVRSAATDATPDEGYTAGSASLEQGGAALGRAAAAYRRSRAAGEQPTGPIRPDDLPRWQGTPLGQPVPREDLVAKLTGSPAYLHDVAFADMAHARALLPPTYDARPSQLDVAAARSMPGVLAVHHDGGLIVVVAERQDQADRAVERLAATAHWDDPGLAVADGEQRPEPVVADPGVTEALAAGRRVRAFYAKPYEAHASIAPSAALAWAEPDHLTVWTHNQGVYPLRRELAAMLGVEESTLRVRHVDGPGCYGHNGADDAAGFAVVAARAVPGRPVRFAFSVADEFGWEPYGPAMRAGLEAALGSDGRITGWRQLIRTGAHTSRPRGTGDRLVASWLRADGPERSWAGGGGGGVRNSLPLYDLPAREVAGTYVDGPLRTSALRTLGAYLNVFAIESFMDELAEEAGTDPLEFRLAQLRDERARAVLETAAEVAGWQPRVGPTGRGQGLAVVRYKNSAAYVAQVIEVTVEPSIATVSVERVVTVCDAGVVVNPDGLRNQLEGGVLQGLSRALHEEVRFGSDGVASRDWTTYPVLRFAEVPALETVLLDRPGNPPLGVGEAATPVTPAALANAVDDRVGIRMRELPLTPARFRARLEQMEDPLEVFRVLT